MTVLYGIKNCDSVKKARRWLENSEQPYEFHDFRSDGLSSELLSGWVNKLGWEVLLNKRSTTWKGLSDADKSELSAEKAQQLMLANPTLIKRPVLATSDNIQAGFREADYESIFANAS